MPKRIPPLSETKIENSYPGKKSVRLFDGYGLCLQIEPNGSKLWRYRYRFEGKQKLISLGKYPDVSLSDARLKRIESRRLLTEGVDPSAARKEERVREKAEMESLFGKPSVRVLIDGTIEIWKGRSVLRVTREEAQFINDLLKRLL
jgi:hypothetical protein